MARSLSRSTRQLYSSRCILQPDQHVGLVRFYAKETASNDPKEMLKGMFMGMKKKFEAAIMFMEMKKKFEAAAKVVENQYDKVKNSRVGLFESMRTKGGTEDFLSFAIDICAKNYDPTKPEFEALLMEEFEKLDKELKKPCFGRSKVDLVLMERVDRLPDRYEFLRKVYTFKSQNNGSQDARSYIMICADTFMDYNDPHRPIIKKIMLDTVEKVEKIIKKPLLINDHKTTSIFKKELYKTTLKFVAERFRESLRQRWKS